MSDWQIRSMKNAVSMMIANGIEPNCSLIARTCGIEDVEIVRAEVERIRTKVPPNTENGCDAK